MEWNGFYEKEQQNNQHTKNIEQTRVRANKRQTDGRESKRRILNEMKENKMKNYVTNIDSIWYYTLRRIFSAELMHFYAPSLSPPSVLGDWNISSKKTNIFYDYCILLRENFIAFNVIWD